jgi:hypothetical protein
MYRRRQRTVPPARQARGLVESRGPPGSGEGLVLKELQGQGPPVGRARKQALVGCVDAGGALTSMQTPIAPPLDPEHVTVMLPCASQVPLSREFTVLNWIGAASVVHEICAWAGFDNPLSINKIRAVVFIV